MYSKELDIMTKKSVSELGAVHPSVIAAPTYMIVMDLVKYLHNQSLQAVPIVEGWGQREKNNNSLLWVPIHTSAVKSRHFVCLFEARLNNTGAYVNFNSLYWIFQHVGLLIVYVLHVNMYLQWFLGWAKQYELQLDFL